ncbi:MAG TPA: toll/interleukin-1 receptor domain-containing protein [Pseudonocardiaceae bacterium]|nr:toll/interleukin-1 receptor domain-containing protein [Pseudonocardiaceae bacterium]
MTLEQVERPAGHAFISYVREDAADVDRLQGMLEAAGIRVWRDTENLWPGQDWKTEIKNAITNGSLAFIACFSKHSQRREKSYQNEEFILAVEQMCQRTPGRSWLIPLRFSECTLPQYDLGAGRSLDSIQRVDLFDQGWEQGGARLVAAVMRTLGTLQVENTGHSRSFRPTVGAAAVLAAARAVGLLIETCRQQRRAPSEVATAWRAWRKQIAWSMPAYDLDGNRLTVEPPMIETRAREAQLSAALAEAVAALEPIAATVIAELHSVRAADEGLIRWCQWVQRATEVVVTAAGRWPGNPPTEDDEVLSDTLTELQHASAALSAAWRQEEAVEPPEPPPPDPEPVETDQQRRLREHRELLDTARPWARSQRRPYDADLCARLIETAQCALELPHVPSLLPIGLRQPLGSLRQWPATQTTRLTEC